MEKIIVNSLTEYIETIQDLSIEGQTIYRGQSSYFPTMNSSAFRMNLLGKGNKVQGFPFSKICNEFKYEIWTELDQDSRNSFLAFCQHHGMPTNLLDYSYNPLIALYFAVSKINNPTYTQGPAYIYVINKPVIDVTDIMEKYGSTNENIFEMTFSEDLKLLELITAKFRVYERKHPKIFYSYFKELNNDIKNIITANNSNHEYIDDKIFDSILQNIDNYESWEQIPIVFNIELTHFKNIVENLIYDNATLYLMYLVYFRMLLNINEEWPKYYNGLIPMIYKPILSFKRGINQKGLFVYQNYLEYDPHYAEGYIDYTVQSIIPDYIIEIPAFHRQILDTLDLLDVNKKFVYGDFENTANYIFEKYKRF